MGFLSKLFKIAKKTAPIWGPLIPGGGPIIGGIGGLGGAAPGAGFRRLPPPGGRGLPPVMGRPRRGPGAIIGAAGVGAVAGTIIGYTASGEPIYGKRRRRQGITAAQLKGFYKVNRLLCSVGMVPRKPRARKCR